MQNLPADDPLGIDAWSASCGFAPHIGLAVITCVLSGVAGPLRSFQIQTPGDAGIGCNFIAREEDSLISMAVSELIQRLCHVQKCLVMKARDFTTKELTDALYEPNMRRRHSDCLAKLRDPEWDASEISEMSVEGKLARDSEMSKRQILFDGLTRPLAIRTGSLRGGVAKMLAGCHGGFGFSAGCVEALPSQTGARNCRVNEIIDAMRGITMERASMGGHIVNALETVRLSGLLRFPEADFEWIIENRRDLPTMALPISSLGDSGAGEGSPVDEMRAARFLTLFQQVAHNAFASRRAHAWMDMYFVQEQSVHEFLRLQRAFTRIVHQTPGPTCVHGAASLPGQMAWALLLLAGRNNLDDYIVRTVFDSAKALHAETVRLFASHDQAILAQRRLVVARKLVARVSQKGPCKRRFLVRGLDEQSLHLHEPIIRVLIEHGIFVERQDGVLALGQVSLKTLAPAKLIASPPP